MDPETGDGHFERRVSYGEILKRLPDDMVRHIILSDPDEQRNS